MPSTPSSSSTFSHSLSHNLLTSPSPSSPSIDIPSRDANSITNVNVNAVTTHDLPLSAPTTPISSACAACKYQRRKCGPQCMLAPYFPPERQSDFQNAHKLFGVSNIVKKLRQLSAPDRQKAVNTMVFEANVRAENPSRGCYGIIRYYEEFIIKLERELAETQHQINNFRANQCNFETNQHDIDQPYPGMLKSNRMHATTPQPEFHAKRTIINQSQSSFVSLDDINLSQNKLQNETQEQRLQNYLYFNGNQTNRKNNNNGDIGGHDTMTYNYVNNNNYNMTEQQEQEQEQDQDELRPFMDILPICSDNEEEDEELVCKSSVDLPSLNSQLDTSTQCSLGLGFSDF